MKKYGLQIRVPPSQQKKPPTRPPLPRPLGFREEDDDDDVEKEISRQASKNKALKEVEEQHKKALQEDPSVFDYDGVYDEMKDKVVRPKIQDKEERKPKYIQNLIKKAEQRKQDQEIVYERKLAKERSKEDHLYEDKDRFVTGAYKRKLAEQAKWLELERLRELKEEKDDVTKKSDLSDFYFNLDKNVAFGAKEGGLIKKQKPLLESSVPEHNDRKEAEKSDKVQPNPDGRQHPESSNAGDVPNNERPRETSEPSSTAKPPTEQVAADLPVQESSDATQPTANEEKRDHHKRAEDAVAAARERFLARKKGKQQ